MTAAQDRPAVAGWFEEVGRRLQGSTGDQALRWEVGRGSVVLRALDPEAAALTLPALAGTTPVDLGAPSPPDDGGTRPTWVAVSGEGHLPPPPFGADDLRPRDGVAGFSSGRYRLAWAIERQVLWALDLETGFGWTWSARPEAAAPWDRAAPWRPQLAWWMGQGGGALAHAAAIAPPGRPGAGCLLVGPGGAGKSTLALAAAQAGWSIAGDDYVTLSAPPPGRRSWRVGAPYRLAKVTPGSRRLLDLDDRALVPGADHLGKALVDLPSAFGERGAVPLDLAVVVVPVLGPRTEPPTSVPPAGALAALGASSVLQTPGDAAATLAGLRRAVADVPTFRMVVGPDLGVAVDALASIVEDGRAA